MLRSRRLLITCIALLLSLLLGAGRIACADVYTVTSTDDDGPGTLRQAILAADAAPGSSSIVFSIASGAQTIQPLSPLPPLTQPGILLDAATQPGYSGQPLIELDGSQLPTSDGNGLQIAASNCAVQGFVINRFGSAGVYVTPLGSGAIVSGCWLGTDATGSNAVGNTFGVVIDGASGVRVSSCVISGNGIGASLFSGASSNTLVNNDIGTDFAGGSVTALGNLQGVSIMDSSSNTLDSNIISGSVFQGVVLSGAANANTLVNNLIGFDLYYDAVGNGAEGVDIEGGTGNILRANTIGVNAGAGIALANNSTTGSVVQSNFLLANANGVEIRYGSANNLVGGADGALGNTIQGNNADGVTLTGAGTSGNALRQNVIQGNGQYGVSAYSSDNQITGNQINDNVLDGVWVGQQDDGAYAVHVAILSNSIWNNGDLGIHLDTDGTRGGNNLQPAPILSYAITGPDGTGVVGSLLAAPNTAYQVQFFFNQDANLSGYGEGQTYLDTLTVTTDTGGSATFFLRLAPVTSGGYLSATATAPDGNTSDFSLAQLVGDSNPGPTITAISPQNALRNSGAFTLAVTGTGFVPGATIRWNGLDRATTFVSSTQLMAVIPASDLTQAGTFPVMVFNPAPGGGESNSLLFTVNNPIPVLTALNPPGVLVGSDKFTLTLTGSNFVPESVVQWNGTARATTYVSATTLTIDVSALDVSVAGTVDITVSTPGPGGGASGSLPFSIANPAPVLTSLSPGTATAGASSFTMTLTGAHFLPASKVQWNGTARATSYLSPTQLQIVVSRADVAAPGTTSVTVFTPTPGGGVSNALPFTVNGIPQLAITLAIAARDRSVTVTFTLKNIGTAPITGARLTGAKLDGLAATSTLPVALGDIPVGASLVARKVTFPGTVGAGSKLFAVTVTGVGKSLSTSRMVLVP